MPRERYRRDLIIAGRYLRTKDRSVWAEHVFGTKPCACSPSPQFGHRRRAEHGLRLVREQAVIALRKAGLVRVMWNRCRIFFRNAINVGLPLISTVSCIDGAASFDQEDDCGVDGKRCPARPLQRGCLPSGPAGLQPAGGIPIFPPHCKFVGVANGTPCGRDKAYFLLLTRGPERSHRDYESGRALRTVLSSRVLAAGDESTATPSP